ncbi:c-type cytochrome biogenesis protein CcmI [Azoarcus sp. TTM-91]|uniref:c-type cytochrome biogenesis protein CcmI n=1 Tax=Azoarcus sp. TTM-91 TaxID=2691581 RepID=UPI0032B7FCBF
MSAELSTLLPFIVGAAVLVGVALLLLLPPLFRSGRKQAAVPADADAGQAETALVVLREQLADLEAEHAAGRMDEATYRRSRDELERRALDEGEAGASTLVAAPSRYWAVVVAIGVPVMAAAVYLILGNPAGLDPRQIAGEQQFDPQQIAGMVNTLAERMEKEPDNVEGWSMLARSYVVLEDYAKAAAAYAHVAERVKDDPDLLADWADVVAARDRSVAGEAEQIAKRALELDPGHPKSRLLAGTASYQRGDYAGASAHWERILATVPPGDPVIASLLEGINDARAKGGLPPLSAPAAPAAPAAAAGQGELSLSGRLALAPALADKVKADDVVFVFVRGEAGGAPLAALRFTAGELPRDFSFSGVPRMAGDSPVPPKVTLAARVAKSGNPSGGPGDLEGRMAGLAPDTTGVALVIDQMRE